jgi:hypothetical protein
MNFSTISSTTTIKIILIIVIIFSGILLFLTGKFSLPEGLTNQPNTITCPDLLIQNGENYFLYNSKAPTVKGINPLVFTKLSDYADYVSANPSCPVLFLQKGSDAQGNDIFNVRPGTPLNTGSYNGLDQTPPLANGNLSRTFSKIFGNQPILTTSFVDSTLQNPPYNQYNTPGYAAYDPRGFDVGRFNPLDAIHLSGELLPVSDSPSDSNWGGTEYTERQVESGKYIGNEVYKPNLSGGSRMTITR